MTVKETIHLTNYNEKYTQIAAQLTEALRSKSAAFTYGGQSYNITDRTERITLIDRICADYIASEPASVDMALLDRLADAILNEELTENGGGHKAANAEYPFLSETQMNRRRYGSRGGTSTNMNGETTMRAAEFLGADGRDYRFPNRRLRTLDELIFVDTRAKSRNKARAAQYRKDTAPGRVVTYNLRDTGGELAAEFEACQGVGERWRSELSAVY